MARRPNPNPNQDIADLFADFDQDGNINANALQPADFGRFVMEQNIQQAQPQANPQAQQQLQAFHAAFQQQVHQNALQAQRALSASSTQSRVSSQRFRSDTQSTATSQRRGGSKKNTRKK